MKNMNAAALDNSTLGVCVFDLKGDGLYRNKNCTGFCKCPIVGPDDTRDMCIFNDLRSKFKGEVLQVYRAIKIGEAYFDAVLIRDTEHEYFMLYALDDKLRTIRDELKGKKLTQRELEITSLMLLGLRNQQLCDRLKISINTLRTHLKSIYRKIPRATQRALGIPDPN